MSYMIQDYDFVDGLKHGLKKHGTGAPESWWAGSLTERDQNGRTLQVHGVRRGAWRNCMWFWTGVRNLNGE